jgi:hypothetical protein
MLKGMAADVVLALHLPDLRPGEQMTYHVLKNRSGPAPGFKLKTELDVGKSWTPWRRAKKRTPRAPRTRRERRERTMRRLAHEAALARRAAAVGVTVAELGAYDDAVRRLKPSRFAFGIDWASDGSGDFTFTQTGRARSSAPNAQVVGRQVRTPPPPVHARCRSVP